MNKGLILAADPSRGAALLGACIRWVCGASRALAAGRLDTQDETLVHHRALTYFPFFGFGENVTRKLKRYSPLSTGANVLL